MLEAGSEDSRAGAGDICVFRLLLPVQLRRKFCNLAVSQREACKLDRPQLYPVLGVKMYLLPPVHLVFLIS